MPHGLKNITTPQNNFHITTFIYPIVKVGGQIAEFCYFPC
jgi:hypothetical protein